MQFLKVLHQTYVFFISSVPAHIGRPFAQIPLRLEINWKNHFSGKYFNIANRTPQLTSHTGLCVVVEEEEEEEKEGGEGEGREGGGGGLCPPPTGGLASGLRWSCRPGRRRARPRGTSG